jgi:phage baseplate assembly protein W
MATTRNFAVEDGNLSSSLTTARVRKFSDVDLSFTPRATGDIFKKQDLAAIKQSVKNILLTGKLEKPFNPDFSGGLGNILFENMDDITQVEIETAVSLAIRSFEPRAILDTVSVKPNIDRNELHVTVRFGIKNTGEQVTLDTTLSRLR